MKKKNTFIQNRKFAEIWILNIFSQFEVSLNKDFKACLKDWSQFNWQKSNLNKVKWQDAFLPFRENLFELKLHCTHTRFTTTILHFHLVPCIFPKFKVFNINLKWRNGIINSEHIWWSSIIRICSFSNHKRSATYIWMYETERNVVGLRLGRPMTAMTDLLQLSEKQGEKWG